MTNAGSCISDESGTAAALHLCKDGICLRTSRPTSQQNKQELEFLLGGASLGQSKKPHGLKKEVRVHVFSCLRGILE